jgi:23S rRNA (cytosine1962-C5)-methyltransferase
MRFFIKPLEAVNAGIFVDTRDIREYLRTHSFGKRVLNLFCYTGLLGLAASVGKAAEVVQVDVSKRVLAWAKENWQLNAETGAGPTRFICEDSSAFLDKEARRVARGKQGYDIVIIDPPAYGAAGKGGFSLLRDLPTLVAGIMKVLGPNGELLLMCNLRELSSARLADIVSDAASKSGRDLVSCVELMAPATDFRASSLQASSMRGVQAKLA